MCVQGDEIKSPPRPAGLHSKQPSWRRPRGFMDWLCASHHIPAPPRLFLRDLASDRVCSGFRPEAERHSASPWNPAGTGKCSRADGFIEQSSSKHTQINTYCASIDLLLETNAPRDPGAACSDTLSTVLRRALVVTRRKMCGPTFSVDHSVTSLFGPW